MGSTGLWGRVLWSTGTADVLRACALQSDMARDHRHQLRLTRRACYQVRRLSRSAARAAEWPLQGGQRLRQLPRAAPGAPGPGWKLPAQRDSAACGWKGLLVEPSSAALRVRRHFIYFYLGPKAILIFKSG